MDIRPVTTGGESFIDENGIPRKQPVKIKLIGKLKGSWDNADIEQNKQPIPEKQPQPTKPETKEVPPTVSEPINPAAPAINEPVAGAGDGTEPLKVTPEIVQQMTQKTGQNAEENPLKVTPVVKRKKVLSLLQREVKLKTYNDPRSLAMQYFASGGKLHPDSLFELYGTKGKENDPIVRKKVESERRPRFTWVSKSQGQTINQIAHYL